MLSIAAIALVAAEPAMTAPALPLLSAAEQAAIFRAAGARKIKDKWILCSGDPEPQGAVIAEVRDINADGRPDALITDSGSYCYGAAGTGYAIVSEQEDNRWKLIAKGTGIPQFLPTRGIEGWPDLSIGGPGTCFPVQFWSKKDYVTYRYAYEGKPCMPNR